MEQQNPAGIVAKLRKLDPETQKALIEFVHRTPGEEAIPKNLAETMEKEGWPLFLRGRECGDPDYSIVPLLTPLEVKIIKALPLQN